MAGCRRSPSSSATNSPYLQVVTAQPRGLGATGEALPPLKAHWAVAVAASLLAPHDSDATLNGVRAMVLTVPLARGLALQLAAPLATVDAELASIGATLAVLSVIGVSLAALAGWAVARAGLAPVARLAAVAEDVTAPGIPPGEVHRADELGRLAASFNPMLGALRRSHAAQRQLVSDASHELRTPLTSLRLNAELLAGETILPEAERREVLARIAAQVAELGQLVPASPSWPGTSRSPARWPRSSWMRLSGQPGGGPPGLAPAIFRRSLSRAVAGAAPTASVAVRNLLDNAAKFGSPGRGRGVLGAGELTVRDYGRGIAPADLPLVFERFYRAPGRAAPPAPGSGWPLCARSPRPTAERSRWKPGRAGTLIRSGSLVGPRAPPPARRWTFRAATAGNEPGSNCAQRRVLPGRVSPYTVLPKVPATLRAIQALPSGEGCSPPRERGKDHARRAGP